MSLRFTLPRQPFTLTRKQVLRISGEAVGWALAAAWLYKAITSRRGLRQVPSLNPSAKPSPATVAVIVPARNEAASLPFSLPTLLAQSHPGLRIIAVDDRSTDETGAILDSFVQDGSDRLSVLHIHKLPFGWTGKAHAMASAVRLARSRFSPDWLLFTDADVLFAPYAVASSIRAAEHLAADHFVTLPTAILRSAGESVVMGYLQVIGLWATRLWRVSDPGSRDAAGIGAFNLLRTSAYDAVGGFEHLRMQILEDLTLARRVRNLGLRQQVAFSPGAVRVHWAPGWRGILATMTKNLFAIFGYSPLRLAAGCLGLFVLCIGPFAMLVWRPGRPAGVVAVISIGSLYYESRKFSRIGTWTVLGFAPSAALFLFAILRSAWTTLHHGGVTWRGTFYSLPELRRQVEAI